MTFFLLFMMGASVVAIVARHFREREDPDRPGFRSADSPRPREAVGLVVQIGVVVAIGVVMIWAIRLVEPDDRPTISQEEIAALIPPPPGPSDVDSRVWDLVGVGSAARIVVPSAPAAVEFGSVVGSTDSTVWSYSLVWGSADGRRTEIVVSSPSSTEPDSGATSIWNAGAPPDRRALVVRGEGACGASDGRSAPLALDLSMLDVLGDVVADISLRAGSGDPCASSGHALTDEELVAFLGSLAICRPDRPAPSGFACNPLPLDDADLRAGAEALRRF
jgi:hypothetical protein